MKSQDEICSKCLGAITIMEPKPDKGFEYKTCSLCNGVGTVTKELAEDFELSINEDLIDDYD